MATDDFAAVRLPVPLMERARRLIPLAHRLPELLYTRPTLATVVRVAVSRGLDLVEKDLGVVPVDPEPFPSCRDLPTPEVRKG